MKIFIDNGHGINTPGKCSPDGELREYEWTREIAMLVVCRLKQLGYDASLLTPELQDIPLSVRVSRVNAYCLKHSAKDAVVVSIHNNASPPNNGKWHPAHGFSVYVSTNKKGVVSKGSALLADCIVAEAASKGTFIRKCWADKSYWIKSLAITRDTLCPAVLTECFYMDNKQDYDWLMSMTGKAMCADIHVDAIIQYVNIINH